MIGFYPQKKPTLQVSNPYLGPIPPQGRSLLVQICLSERKPENECFLDLKTNFHPSALPCSRVSFPN